ncbi:hypothetical protein INR49_004460, partial [Caranx melampygus]
MRNLIRNQTRKAKTGSNQSESDNSTWTSSREEDRVAVATVGRPQQQLHELQSFPTNISLLSEDNMSPSGLVVMQKRQTQLICFVQQLRCFTPRGSCRLAARHNDSLRAKCGRRRRPQESSRSLCLNKLSFTQLLTSTTGRCQQHCVVKVTGKSRPIPPFTLPHVSTSAQSDPGPGPVLGLVLVPVLILVPLLISVPFLVPDLILVL